jgi:hypothetical protein
VSHQCPAAEYSLEKDNMPVLGSRIWVLWFHHKMKRIRRFMTYWPVNAAQHHFLPPRSTWHLLLHRLNHTSDLSFIDISSHQNRLSRGKVMGDIYLYGSIGFKLRTLHLLGSALEPYLQQVLLW